MQLSNNNLTLYSGAGITASSVPEKEWDETENKLMTLKQVLFSS
jgi:isochorismate synthase